MRGLNSSTGAGAVHLAAGVVAVVASTREGAEVTLWNAETGAVVRRVPNAAGILGFGFSPDGRILATSNWSDSTITLWDAKSGANRGRLTGATAVDALALDADGRRLAALTEPDTIRFWQLGVRERRGSVGLIAMARGRFEDERQMTFSADGRKLFVIGLGSKPVVFNVDERTWPEVACRIAGRGLTRAEWLRYVGTGFEYEQTCE
jgi:WD40 repeat protein